MRRYEAGETDGPPWRWRTRIEDDTPIVPRAVAMGVCEEASLFLGEPFPREWATELVERAEEIYQHNARFHRSGRSLSRAETGNTVFLDFSGFRPLTGAVQDSGPRRSNAARIQIVPPARFGAGAQFAVHACGLVLVLPVLAAALVMSLGKFALWKLLLPLAAVAGTAYFLPFGLGNAFLTRLARALDPAAGKDPDAFIVQLTLSPRIRSGLWAELEDADDIGCLRLTEAELRFEGDSVKVSLPYSQIARLRPRNIGLRGLFVYGRRIVVEVSGLSEASALEFAERSSWVLPASRRTTQRLWEGLSAKLAR
jgi:hypothetical protein